jgi:hypothetical protein
VAAQRPHGASFKFLGDLERQVSTVAKSIYDEGKYIGKLPHCSCSFFIFVSVSGS